MGLWEVLRTDGDAHNIANVEALVKYAAGKLTLVRETFPDYTMHDRQHAENVVALTEKLLGPGIGALTPLEAAMLILAAYFHDIGMVYSQDELAALVEDEDFRDFLDKNSAAYIRAHDRDEIPQDVIVEYCRARHADRVAEHVFQLDASLRTWDGVGIGEELSRLCRSHMQSRDVIRSDDFPTAFLGSCDLRLCAILLRLADILDLDDTRAPAAIYSHLKLAGSAEGARAVSDAEWSKHIASRGFKFPDERNASYSLLFLAGPRKPAVEQSIRKFLDVVEQEVRGCRILLDFCDGRWRSLALPGSIDRSGIRSEGYRYGEYRFTLDRHEILHLFMGEQLYSNPYTFIRELLQNAIDACRLNVYLHDASQDDMEVRISAWEDAEGNYWFRVDDTGVGMDQEIIEKYFLGVGRSYYRSEELDAEILRKNKPQQKFVAISRFGIGVLSSFIVGNQIEVSTRRRLPNGKLAPPVRLSLDSLDDFFVMQDHPMQPTPFPGQGGEETGYRKAAGTSIAVKMDPTKSDVILEDMLKYARRSLFYPPVKVYVNGIKQRAGGYEELDVPFLDAPRKFPVTAKKPDILLTFTNLSAVVIPLDLTANSPSSAVRGQLIAIAIEASGPSGLLPIIPPKYRTAIPPHLRKSLKNCIYDRQASISMKPESGHELQVSLNVSCQMQAILELEDWLKGRAEDDDGLGELRNFVLRSNALSDPKKGSVDLQSTFAIEDQVFNFSNGATFDSLITNWLGYNGITVSTRLEVATGDLISEGEEVYISRGGVVIVGPVCLSDELRPNVSVSRDVVRSFSFGIRSALQMAVRRAAAAYFNRPERIYVERITELDLLTEPPVGEISADQIERDLLISEWRKEQIIPVGNEGFRSVEEVRQLAKGGPVDLDLPIAVWVHGQRDPIREGFYSSLRLGMAELYLDIELKYRAWSRDQIQFESLRHIILLRPQLTVCSGRQVARPSGLSALPVFFAVRYQASDCLSAGNCPANLNNPIVAWFAEHASLLRDEYPALFAQFRRTLAKVADSWDRQEIVGVQDLMNATLARMRRSVPYATEALAREVYVDESGELRS